MKIKYFFLFLSIIYSLSFSFWSIWGDTYYWINHFDLYKQEFMTILSMWLGQQWCILFGKTVISTRILSWLLCSLAMFIPYFFLQNKIERKNNVHLLALGYVFMGYGNYNFYNPDATTVFTLSALSTSILCYLRKPSIYLVLLIAMISSISFAFRFPNIVILPWISIILFLLNYKIHELKFKNNITTIGIYIIVSLFFYYFIVRILSSESNVVPYAINAVINQKVGPTHSMTYLLWAYSWDFIRVSAKLGLIISVLYLMNKYIYYKGFRKYKLLISCTVYIILMILFVNKWGSIDWIRLYSFSMIIMIILITRKIYKDNNSIKYIIMAGSLISFGLIAAAGSDTGWLKMFPYFIAFTPIIFKYYKDYLPYNIEHKHFLISSLLLSIYTFYTNNYQSYSIMDMKGYYDNKLIKNVALDKKTLDIYNISFIDINKYATKDKIIFYGVGIPHHLYALTETKPLYQYSFWMFKNDMKELEEVLSCMKEDKDVILFDFTKSDDEKFLKQLIKIESNSYYTIYTYKNGN